MIYYACHSILKMYINGEKHIINQAGKMEEIFI